MSSRLTWIKSSYSDAQGSDCIEIALDSYGSSTAIHVRDSKLGEDGPTFAVPAGAWAAFLAQVG
ncbi:DUF397 domain-containing protein [Streptomyces sp. NPDC001194]|uniref:DUF397 domain-containing protein n=1 Tax=Streptomyces sp. NPDC001194 TaxID=3364547 RepID=UPI003696A46B